MLGQFPWKFCDELRDSSAQSLTQGSDRTRKTTALKPPEVPVRLQRVDAKCLCQVSCFAPAFRVQSATHAV